MTLAGRHSSRKEVFVLGYFPEELHHLDLGLTGLVEVNCRESGNMGRSELGARDAVHTVKMNASEHRNGSKPRELGESRNGGQAGGMTEHREGQSYSVSTGNLKKPRRLGEHMAGPAFLETVQQHLRAGWEAM